MGLVRYIYTSILAVELPPQNAFDTASLSANVCEKIGITGRTFANCHKALAITEGPTDIVEKYFQAVNADPLAQTILMHVQRPIKAREFEDYSVWLNLGQAFEFSASVRELTPDTLAQAWPGDLSAKVRIMADVYLDPEMLAA